MGFSAEGMLEVFRRLGSNVIGVEVGVCCGENTKAILDNCSNVRKIYAVDPWTAYSAIDQKTQNENYKKARSLLTSYELDDSVEIQRRTSQEAVELFKDKLFDFVYIDGDHAYDAVLADCRAWWPLVKPGGILSGHDFRVKDTEVRNAVYYFGKEIFANVIETKFSSWYIEKY